MNPSIVFRGQSLLPEVFQARVMRSAQALQEAGLREGDVLALLMRNNPQMLELMLAARWLGALWCPINWHFRTDEVQHILDDCQPTVLVADAALLAALPGLRRDGISGFVFHDAAAAAPTVGATRDAHCADWEAVRDAAGMHTQAARPPRGPMLYTSGTTGRPKGIRRASANAEQLARGRAVLHQVLGFTAGMRALISAPMYHSAPNSFSIGAALEGATLYIEPSFDALATLRMIEQQQITHVYLVPTMYVRLLALPDAVRKRHDLRSVRFVSSTGSPCPIEVKRAMIDWWGPVIHEAYGSSELGYMTLLDSADALRKPGSAGRPLQGVRLAILDENGVALPAGQIGLIHADQPAYADFTYVGNNAARQRMERDGLKTMGDIGYLDEEGFLYIVDRANDMVISGGVNIYPAEIEAVLLSMPGVADCAVFGIPDDEFGESLAAAVQPLPGTALAADSVLDYLRPRLARYKLPRQISFVEAMPREDTGKIFKRKLREPYWAGRSRRV